MTANYYPPSPAEMAVRTMPRAQKLALGPFPPAVMKPAPWGLTRQPLDFRDARPPRVSQPGPTATDGAIGSVSLRANLDVDVGQRFSDRRQITIPAPARLEGLSVSYKTTGFGTGRIWVAIPTHGYFSAAELHNANEPQDTIDATFGFNITTPATLEIGYEVLNPGAILFTEILEIYANLAYQPIA
jgi:hypothetical protein